MAITDNSKVNQNLLEEVDRLTKRVKELEDLVKNGSLHLVSFPLPIGTKVIENGEEKTVTNNIEKWEKQTAYRLDENEDALYILDDFEEIIINNH